MKTKLLLLSALAALTLAACQKDNDRGLLLVVEDMTDGAKMAVENNIAYWATGDQVRINGETLTVSIDESAGTATAVSSNSGGFEAPYFGVYPASIYSGNSGDSYTLNLPASYTYATTTHFGSTMQNLGTPMVAYNASGTELLFKHITAALNVKVVNDFGVDVRVANITISSNKYQLSGATTLTVGSDINVAPASAEGDGNAALRQVQMTFAGTQLIIPSGGNAIVQVPVLPVGNDNRFTISVTVQNKDDADMTWTFSKTQAGNSSDGYALGRAMVGYAPAKFGGVFTVAPGKQVYIAPGNLQYQASSGTWRFAKHQYDAIGNALGNSNFTDTRSTQADWIDLFGWGTSGHNHGNTNYMPYVNWYTSGSYACGYGPRNGYNYNFNLTIDNNGDWGVNAISNGGNVAAIWRTMTQGQIDTLLTKRTCSTVNGIENSHFAKATVCGVNGLIILPDEYTHPVGVKKQLVGLNATGNGGWSQNVYDASDWALMEVAGAVFLPITGKSGNQTVATSPLAGYYWSSSFYTSSGKYFARCLYFTDSNFEVTNYQYRYYGCAVRLVRDVQ